MSGNKGKKDKNTVVANPLPSVAISQLTLSERLVSSNPPSVRLWDVNHCVAWLEDVFSSSDDLPL